MLKWNAAWQVPAKWGRNRKRTQKKDGKCNREIRERGKAEINHRGTEAQRGKPQPMDLNRSKQSKRRKTRQAAKNVFFLSVSSVSSCKNFPTKVLSCFGDGAGRTTLGNWVVPQARGRGKSRNWESAVAPLLWRDKSRKQKFEIKS